MPESRWKAPAVCWERSVHYFDEFQVQYWRKREAEERQLAERSIDGARISHLQLADSYAILIAQTTGQKEENSQS